VSGAEKTRFHDGKITGIISSVQSENGFSFFFNLAGFLTHKNIECIKKGQGIFYQPENNREDYCYPF